MTAVLMVLGPLQMRMAEAAARHTPKLAGKFEGATGHPEKESTERGDGPWQREKSSRLGIGAEPERIGGREFGNVIEPTQAQMASGNRGLAAEPAQTKKKTARKKAA